MYAVSVISPIAWPFRWMAFWFVAHWILALRSVCPFCVCVRVWVHVWCELRWDFYLFFNLPCVTHSVTRSLSLSLSFRFHYTIFSAVFPLAITLVHVHYFICFASFCLHRLLLLINPTKNTLSIPHTHTARETINAHAKYVPDLVFNTHSQSKDSSQLYKYIKFNDHKFQLCQ